MSRGGDSRYLSKDVIFCRTPASRPYVCCRTYGRQGSKSERAGWLGLQIAGGARISVYVRHAATPWYLVAAGAQAQETAPAGEPVHVDDGFAG